MTIVMSSYSRNAISLYLKNTVMLLWQHWKMVLCALKLEAVLFLCVQHHRQTKTGWLSLLYWHPHPTTHTHTHTHTPTHKHALYVSLYVCLHACVHACTCRKNAYDWAQFSTFLIRLRLIETGCNMAKYRIFFSPHLLLMHIRIRHYQK